MAYKSVKQHTAFKENPFIEKAIDDIKIIRKTQVIRPKNRDEIQMIVSSSGEIEGHTAFMKYVEVDEEQFAKVYLSQFTAFWELPKSAIRVFGFIINSLKPKKDEFYLEMNKCLEYTKYKHPKDVLSGLSALIECEIIARSDSHFKYFINPLVVFNGDRVSFAKTYIKKKKQAIKEQLERQNQLKLSNTVLDAVSREVQTNEGQTGAIKMTREEAMTRIRAEQKWLRENAIPLTEEDVKKIEIVYKPAPFEREY